MADATADRFALSDINAPRRKGIHPPSIPPALIVRPFNATSLLIDSMNRDPANTAI
jgi:hypothetical protein